MKVSLSCNKDFFSPSDTLYDSIEQLHFYQEAYENAQMFYGANHVTEKGYLIRGFKTGLKIIEADCDLCENISGLRVLDEAIKNKLVNPNGSFLIEDQIDDDEKIPRPRGMSILHGRVAHARPTVHLHSDGDVIRLEPGRSHIILPNVFDNYKESKIWENDKKMVEEELMIYKAETTCPERIWVSS